MAGQVQIRILQKALLNALFIHVQKFLIALSPLGRRQP